MKTIKKLLILSGLMASIPMLGMDLSTKLSPKSVVSSYLSSLIPEPVKTYGPPVAIGTGTFAAWKIVPNVFTSAFTLPLTWAGTGVYLWWQEGKLSALQATLDRHTKDLQALKDGQTDLKNGQTKMKGQLRNISAATLLNMGLVAVVDKKVTDLGTNLAAFKLDMEKAHTKLSKKFDGLA